MNHLQKYGHDVDPFNVKGELSRFRSPAQPFDKKSGLCDSIFNAASKTGRKVKCKSFCF